MQIRTGENKTRRIWRLTVAAVTALIIHGLLYWGFAIMRPRFLSLLPSDQVWRSPVELWQMPDVPAQVSHAPLKHVREAPGAPADEKAKPADTSQAVQLSSSSSATGAVSSEKLSQAMQGHAVCVSLQTAGKPLPSNCRMADLASHPALGPKPDEGLQVAVVQKDYVLQYKTTPGNSDYWKRVAGTPTDGDLHHCSAQPGTYSNAKDQRVMRCWAPDPKNGYGVH